MAADLCDVEKLRHMPAEVAVQGVVMVYLHKWWCYFPALRPMGDAFKMATLV